MGFLGWGLFGALFAVSDEVNTRKKSNKNKHHQQRESLNLITTWIP